MTKHLALTVAILYSSLVLAPSASACQCFAVDSSPCASAKRGDFVFVGTVLTDEPIVMETGTPRFPHEAGRRLGLSVQETLVGTARNFVHVQTSRSSCGFPFEVGEQYLVYAGVAENNTYGTWLCTRTGRLADRRDDLSLLRQLRGGQLKSRLFGQVRGRVLPPLPHETSAILEGVGMPNVIVTARGAGRREETVTDAGGWFAFVGLPPGTYTVQAQPPPDAPQLKGKRVTLDRCGAEAYFMFDLPRR